MAKDARKVQKRIERCQRLVVLGTIAGVADDREAEARYLAAYEHEFAKLPLMHQLEAVHQREVVMPVRAQFTQHGVLGMRERAVAEDWAAEFAD